MTKRETTSSAKPPVDRKPRARPRPTRTLRARADAAIITQWLSEQAATADAPKAPAAA